MKKSTQISFEKSIFVGFLMLFSTTIFAQGNATSACEFWKKVQYGGGVGLNISNGYTNISLAPSAKYDVNQYFSTGVGLQGSYVSGNNSYNSFIYGASIFALANVSEEIQLSVDLDELKVNTSYPTSFGLPSRHFWNTALFLGAGFRTGNITIGAKYNVLYKKEDSVYSDAFMPFVRVYF
jgi:hypothetical protein